MIEVYDAIGTPIMEGIVVCHPVGGKYNWGFVVAKVTKIKEGTRKASRLNPEWKQGDGFSNRYIQDEVPTFVIHTEPLECGRKSREWSVDQTENPRVEKLVVTMNQDFTNENRD